VAIAVVTALQIGYLIGIWLRSSLLAQGSPIPASEATRRPPTVVAQPFARDLAGMTEHHDEDQEHPIRHRSRDRAQWRRKAGPAH
jgi:hypothetical protein